MKQTTAYHKTYDLNDWEGGIGVFYTKGEHGTLVISIPRFRLSTALIGYNDYNGIVNMLMHNPTMYHKPDEMETLANMILNDIRRLN